MNKNIDEIVNMVINEIKEPLSEIIHKLFTMINESMDEDELTNDMKILYLKRLAKAMIGSAISCGDDIMEQISSYSDEYPEEDDLGMYDEEDIEDMYDVY